MKLNSCKLFYFIVIFLCGNSNAFSQKVIGKSLDNLVLPKPCDCYENPTGVVEDDKCKLVEKDHRSVTENYWLVYSDREDNQTYAEVNLLTPFTKLSFMEPCYVAEETKNAVRLVSFSNEKYVLTTKGKEARFKPSAKDLDRGWIDKKYLLLWNHSLTDEKTKVSRKAISVKRLTDKSKIPDYIHHHGILDLYNYPDTLKAYDAEKEFKMFEYLFVYKEDKANNMYLLGKINELTPSQIHDDILGWAPMSEVYPWSSAVCLRINLKEEAVAERKKNHVTVQFFKNLEGAKKYKDGVETEHLPFIFDDPTNEEKAKENPYLLGYPIVDGNEAGEGGIYKTGYITNTVDDKGHTLYTPAEGAKNDNKVENAKSQKDNVVMVFVLDGNSRTYIKTIAKAVEANNVGNEGTSRNKYRYAAIIYNGTECEDGKDIQTIEPMTDKEGFIEALTAAGNASPPCPMNRELNGAPLYKAIYKALFKFNDARTTNIIIGTGSVGSVGDADKSMKADVISQLAEKEVKMFFIQLSNKGGNIYDEFSTEVKDMIFESAKAIDDKQFSKEIKSGKDEASDWDCHGDQCELINSAVPGAFNEKAKGQLMSATEIKDYVGKLLRSNENSLNMLLAQWDNNAEKSDELSPEMVANRKQFELYYKDMGYTDRDITNFLSGNTYKLFIEGWTSTASVKLGKPIFIKTLFLSKNEFDRVYETIGSVATGGSGDEDKVNIYNAFRAILLAYRGGNLSDKQIQKTTIDDLLKMVTNLPLTNTKLFSMPIGQIKTEKQDDKIFSIKKSFSKMYEKLKDVKNNDKFAKYEVDNKEFFWVPEQTFRPDEQ